MLPHQHGAASRRLVAAALLVASHLLVGCKVGPDYASPTAPVAPAWQEADAQGYRADAADVHTWWEAFQDPVLEWLIRTAREQNLDLQAACCRVVEARARAGVVRGGLLPQADVGGSWLQRQFSRNGEAFAFASPAFEPFQLFSAGSVVQWEIDLFGKRQRQLEAAQAEIDVAVEDYRGVMVMLLADAATAYTQLRAQEEQMAIARESLELHRRTLAIAQSRHKSGFVSEFDVRRAEAQVHATAAAIPKLQAAHRESRNHLCVLLGLPPQDLAEMLAIPPNAERNERGRIPRADGSIGVGFPADLLCRRPDVRRAEREIHARCARVGAASAELYPEVTLTGTVGCDSRDLAALFTPNSLAYRIGPAIQWNLLNFGSVHSEIAAADARWGQAIAAYRRTVLIAAEEVENAMTGHLREQQREAELAQGVAAARAAARLAEVQYTRGLAGFVELVDAQRSLLLLQEQHTLSRATITLQRIRLYRALGGGWCPPAAG